MRTNIASRSVLPLFALLTTPAHAGLAWTDATHQLGAAVADKSMSDSYSGLGYFSRSAFISERNDQGTTTAKVEHESLTRDGLIKSTSTFSLHSVVGSPTSPNSGSSINNSFMFSLTSRTTFELLYTINDHSLASDRFNLNITDAAGTSLYQLSENRQAQGTVFLTFNAGDYILNEHSGITAITPDNPGRWSYTTSFTLRVVPAPATLAMLSPIGLLATRRRR